MRRPKLLDLFCGAGGCSMGYSRAGFDVVGVDLSQRALGQYPFPCVRADAMDVLEGKRIHDGGFWPPTRDVELDDGRLNLYDFDVIHASPPCEEYSVTRNDHSREYPRLVEPILALFQSGGWPGLWVVENVPGAPLPFDALLLCGSEWPLSAIDHDGRELRLRRHRLFASNVALHRRRPFCLCAEDRRLNRIGGVYGGGSPDRSKDNPRKNRGGYTPTLDVRRTLMGIEWMETDELSEAIPPAYTEHIGRQLIGVLS